MGDWIALVETAYRLDLEEPAWLASLLEQASKLLPPGGVAGLGQIFTTRAGFFRLDAQVAAGAPADFTRWVDGAIARTPDSGIAWIYRSGLRFRSLREEVARRDPTGTRWAARALGLEDALFAVAPTGSGRGVALGCGLPRAHPPSARERWIWMQVCAHLAAGLRLRDAIGASAPDLDAPDVEGIFDADARVHETRGAAAEAPVRDRLRELVRRRERALRRESADAGAALALWEGLVAGRWSLVDHFDHDGRRFVVARRNDPDVGDPRGLTRRERQIAEYVGMGQSTKEIAYILGISLSAVSNAVARVIRKLGLRARSELAAFFAPCGLRERLVALEVAGEPLLLGASSLCDEAALARLSEAEREVALDLVRGTLLDAIASRRETSPHTVEAQCKAIYRKLGVHSRSELAARLSSSGPAAT